MKLTLTILGSGSSPGVPYLGCRCETCESLDERDKRTRSAAYVEAVGARILIDTPPDLRAQLIREKIYALDAALFTHAHADHVCGIDDLRSFKYLMRKPLDCRADRETIERIKKSFSYIFDESKAEVGGGKPSLRFEEVEPEFEIGGAKIKTFRLPHGPYGFSTGYIIADTLAYFLDCSSIPEDALAAAKGVQIAAIDLVQKRCGHETHLCWDEARDYARRIGAKLTIYSHFGHEIKHSRDGALLDDGEILAYDGLKIRVEENSNLFIIQEEKDDYRSTKGN